MSTIIRAMLAAALLIVSAIVVSSPPVISLLSRIADPTLRRVAFLGLAALAGIISDVAIFALAPAAISWPRRILHAIGVGCVFALGLAALGAARWSAPVLAAGGWDLAASWPFIVLAGIGLAGYVLVSLIIPPGGSGALSLPAALRRYLHDDEVVLYRIQQTRLKERVTPDNLVATDQRLIVHHPANLGFTSTIEDYNYVDIANVKMDRGWLFCTVSLKERFAGDDMVFRGIPKGEGERFVRIVTEQIQRRQRGVPLSSSSGPGSVAGQDEALQTLQRRLAAGEITTQQYDELRNRLSPARGGR